MGKFYDVDPKTCSLDELKAAIDKCKDKVEYYGSLEQGCKRFINSVYGALGSKYYSLSNTDIAESITTQGQDLIKYSVRAFNSLIRDRWNYLTDYHKMIGDAMKEKFPDFNEDKFLELCKKPIEFGETLQAYGDSCSGSTVISTQNGDISIEEMFNSAIDIDDIHFGKSYRKSEIMIKCYDGERIVYSPIRWLIRHKTNKPKYRIYSDATNFVEVTGDHSMITFSDSNCKSECMYVLKPSEIIGGMWLYTTDGPREVFKIEKCGVYNEEYVYDIEVDTDNLIQHNFFGNGILIHNTDSVSYDSIIRTEKHPDGICISDLYDENADNVGDTTLAGHESVNTDDKVLNWTSTKGLTMSNVKRIIRHKVSKPKWRLEARSGESIECTDNHSLILFRDGKEVKACPKDVVDTDSLLIYKEGKPDFCNVFSCKCVGEYVDEYVYDIEMDDDSHTFIANDILVHNSAYISLDPLIKTCGITNEQATDFILFFNKFLMSSYFEYCFNEYAKHYNCPVNLENFELEKIARSLLMQKKKRYVMDIAWKEPDVHVKPLHSLLFKGVEVVKGTSSLYVRNEQREYILWIMDCINKDIKIDYSKVVSKLKEMRQRFILQDPNDICMNMSISNYDKYVYNDKGVSVIYNTGVVVPFQAKAAARYNNMLYSPRFSKYRSKYQMIHSSDKIKLYYIKDGDGEAFAFLPNNFPIEFAPKIDMDKQFENLILNPLNRYHEALGLHIVNSNLTYSNPLW